MGVVEAGKGEDIELSKRFFSDSDFSSRRRLAVSALLHSRLTIACKSKIELVIFVSPLSL